MLGMFLENIEFGFLKGTEVAPIDFQPRLSVRLHVVVKLLLAHTPFTTFLATERRLVVIFVLVQKQEYFLFEIFSTLITGELLSSVHLSTSSQLM